MSGKVRSSHTSDTDTDETPIYSGRKTKVVYERRRSEDETGRLRHTWRSEWKVGPVVGCFPPLLDPPPKVGPVEGSSGPPVSSDGWKDRSRPLPSDGHLGLFPFTLELGKERPSKCRPSPQTGEGCDTVYGTDVRLCPRPLSFRLVVSSLPSDCTRTTGVSRVTVQVSRPTLRLTTVGHLSLCPVSFVSITDFPV